MNNKHYDKLQAEIYLTHLDPTTNTFHFQTFDDDQDRKDGNLSRTFYGTLDQHWDSLHTLSKKGAGVFVAVNSTDGKRRKKENINAVRALWRENDDGHTSNLPLAPHMVVESSPGKYHEYILTEDIPFDIHRHAQEVLVAEYGSDKNAKDLSRLLRLPGFPHQKKCVSKGLTGEPHMVRVINTNEVARYSEEEIKDAFKISPENLKTEFSNDAYVAADDEFTLLENALTNDQISDLREALTYLDADDREEWVRVGQNLKKCADDGYQLWKKWAETSDKFDPSETQSTWRGFTGSHSGYKAIFKRAMQNGWPNMRQSGSVTSLINDINSQLTVAMNNTIDHQIVQEVINDSVVREILRSVLWQPQKSKFLLMSKNQRFKVASEKDVGTFFIAEYGYFYNRKSLDKLCEQTLAEHINSGVPVSPPMQRKNKESAHKAILEALVNYLKVNNQRPKIEFKADPFADKNFVDFSDHDKAVFVFRCQPVEYPLRDGFSTLSYQRAIAEYKIHFPELDKFLKFLVASRFAVDRKRSYLWLNCPSDWGKGFLLGALNDLKYSISLSEKELDKLLGGDPVGRVPSEFIDPFVVVFDECKRVTGNHKLLQSNIPCTPKHEMTVEVPLYGKLFLSAEHIYSLASELGVEAQFANRFSLMTFKGRLSDLEVFNELGSSDYHHACKVYINEFVNREMQTYVVLGKHKAAKVAEAFLNQFHNDFGLANTHELLDASIDDFAREITKSIQAFVNNKYNCLRADTVPESVRRILEPNLIKTDDDRLILKRSHSVIRAHLEAVLDSTSQKMIAYKAKQIAEQIGESKTNRCEVGGKSEVIKGIDLTSQISQDLVELAAY